MIVLVQTSFHTTWASLFEMELKPNSLDWNGNEHKLELEDMKHTLVQSHFDLTLDATKIVPQPVTQMAVELINIHLISVQHKR